MSWIPLKDAPFDIATCPTQIDNDSIIAFPDDYKSKNLYQYSITENAWHSSFAYPSDHRQSYATCAFDADKKMLYAAGSKNYILCVDVNCESLNQATSIITVGLSAGIFPYIAMIKSEIHIVGGHNNKKHFICKPSTTEDENQRLQEIHCFKEWPKGNAKGALIQIASRNEMLLLGGYVKAAGSAGSEGRTDQIWKYERANNQWTLLENLKMPFPMNSFGAIITSDERHIIIFGGVVYKAAITTVDSIFVLNLVTLQWKRSSIQTPVKASTTKDTWLALCAETQKADKDDILVRGYLRLYFPSTVYLPLDVLNLIREWYRSEDVYLFEERGKQCFRISVADILASCS